MTHKWFTENDEHHSQWYAEHFRELASQGVDISGEARLVDAVIAPGSTVLDAGCGQGRTAGALVQRGHRVVAVDVDPVLIEAARTDHPGPTYLIEDLAALDLTNNSGERMLFDACVSAGNVITYVTPGSEVEVLSAIRRHLAPDAPFITGFHVARLVVEDFDAYLQTAGFAVEQRFATWDLRPWKVTADFAVTISRASG